ncbi:hypothetical protein EES39_14230 [Streptomyces sp. ADI92-24]|uniref:DUF397 domain-containing protein n=1 Tax=Streptomyces sp. ADI92-24 TaxID=1522756 RepID=UPI000F550B91|nr:DUF397 domain-containing protein [Streptomyces sp. ADI92-24]RPK46134.1 hypothetical protein EES39_14230 [Streptomyces sp. ADI92-24]
MSTTLTWFKSSYSGNCVEVATGPHAIHVRDSKDLTVPFLSVSPAAWSAFLTYTVV